MLSKYTNINNYVIDLDSGFTSKPISLMSLSALQTSPAGDLILFVQKTW